jgi:excisionase family DNA binding protein
MAQPLKYRSYCVGSIVESLLPSSLRKLGMRPRLISASEIAERLGIQCQTVYLWVRQRRVPFYRVGRLVKFDEAEVLARFKANTDDDDNDRSENDTLSVRTSAGRHSVRRFPISNNRPIDPRRTSGSESSQITERRQRYMAMLGMVK